MAHSILYMSVFLSDICTHVDVTSWRSRILSTKTSSAPSIPSSGIELHDPSNREQFLESLKQKQLAAEARVNQLREQVLETPEEVADNAQSSSDEEEEVADSDEESSDEEEEKSSYENELEYYIGELLCIDAINHDPPSGKEGSCPYCTEGKKFQSDLACSTCAFVRVSWMLICISAPPCSCLPFSHTLYFVSIYDGLYLCFFSPNRVYVRPVEKLLYYAV
jgi:hypothetical protein